MVVFKETAEKNQDFFPYRFPQVLLICCEDSYSDGVIFGCFCLFVLFLSNDLILKWCVCCVFLYFSSLWKLGRHLLKSVLPYIWANLGIRSKYCSNQRTRLPKGLLILNISVTKIVLVLYLNFT